MYRNSPVSVEGIYVTIYFLYFVLTWCILLHKVVLNRMN